MPILCPSLISGLKAAVDVFWEQGKVDWQLVNPCGSMLVLRLVSVSIGQGICFQLVFAHSLPVIKYVQHQPWELVAMLCS